MSTYSYRHISNHSNSKQDAVVEEIAKVTLPQCKSTQLQAVLYPKSCLSKSKNQSIELQQLVDSLNDHPTEN